MPDPLGLTPVLAPCEDSEYWLTKPEITLRKIRDYLGRLGCSMKQEGPYLLAECENGCRVVAESYWSDPSQMIERLGTIGYEALGSGFGAVRLIVKSTCPKLCKEIVLRALMAGGG